MSLPKDVIAWFEIPVTDFARAKKFYAQIIGNEIFEHQMGPFQMGFFPMDMEKQGVGGAIVKSDGYIPSKNGPRVYLNAGDDLNEVLNRVEPAGGKVIRAKTEVGENHGYYAIFEDTEGNYISLHSRG